MNKQRRKAPVCLLTGLLLLLGGCMQITEGSYSVVTEHTEAQVISSEDGTGYEVHTYSGMLSAVQNLVTARQEAGVIRAVDYNGSAQDDIARACLDVTRDYPLASYAVDYISHTISRILGYYEITVHISYKQSAEEMAAIRSEPVLSEMYALMEAGMMAGETHLAVQIATLAVTERTLTNYVENFYRQHPELLYEQPSLSVSFYPEEDSVSKIITFDFTYQTELQTRRQHLSEMNTHAAALLEGLGDMATKEKALYCCNAVAEHVQQYQRSSNAYDVLICGNADSEGCAMAYQLLCNLCGVPCQVVSGKLNGNTHFWNIIRLGQSYYHVDTMACSEAALSCFMNSDAEMIGTYWWDVDRYPACKVRRGTETSAPLPEEAESTVPEA